MRIGIDIRTLNAAGSGQQRYLWRLAHWLSTKGENVHIFSTKTPWPASAGPAGLSVHSLVGSSRAEIREQVRSAALDAFMVNPERASPYAGLPAHVLRPGYGTRQGVQNLQSIRSAGLRAGYSATRWLPWERAALRDEEGWYRSEAVRPHVIALSNLMREAIVRDYGVPSERIHLIPNGVDVEEFSAETLRSTKEVERKRFGIPGDAFCLLFVGHNFRRKGLPETLRALRGNDHLLVAGRGTGRLQRHHARRLVERWGLRGRVHFAGNVVPITDAYAAADALVFPSWHDAFGFVVLEAMAAGLPVVTTRLAGAHEVVRPGVDGFVLETPASREALQEALVSLSDPVRREEMGASAAERASEFSEASNFEAVYAVIRTAAEGR